MAELLSVVIPTYNEREVLGQIVPAVRAAVPDGLSIFWSWWSSMISHSGMWGAIIRAASIISTAPMAKLGATKRLAPSPTPSSEEKSAPVVPITQ
jgi:hypothetical protein